MIRLTDEEIQQAMDSIPFDDSITSYEYGQHLLREYQEQCNRAIAKAQLKKVAGWLHNESVGDPNILGLHPNKADWQALLEEAKE